MMPVRWLDWDNALNELKTHHTKILTSKIKNNKKKILNKWWKIVTHNKWGL